MTSTPFLTAGRILLSLVSIVTSTACYVADYNETHVFNKNWPPHAKFHNGQTMSMGLLLGIVTAYFTWRHKLRPALYGSVTSQKDSIFTAAIVGSLYWITGLSAILYPGTTWIDPEFLTHDFDGKIAGLPGQFLPFSLNAIFAWVGYAVAALDLEKLKDA